MKSLRLSRKQFAMLHALLARIADALERGTAVAAHPADPETSVPAASVKPVVRIKAVHNDAPRASLKQGLFDNRSVPHPSRTMEPGQAERAATVPKSKAQQSDFGIAESGEQYEERMHHERDLALSLGVAPWSPEFQEAIDSMRRDIMKRQIVQEQDEKTGDWRWTPKQFTEEEADQIVREAFQLAKAEANVRRTTGTEGAVA